MNVSRLRSRLMRAIVGGLALAALMLPATVLAAPARNPVGAVRQVDPPGLARGCGAETGRLGSCPVTPRLRHRILVDLQWQRTHTHGGNGNAFCRCQNPPQRVTYRLASNNGSRALVVTRQFYGAQNSFQLTWIVLHRNNRWLVDDQFCTGHPKTSLYARGNYSAGPCPSK